MAFFKEIPLHLDTGPWRTSIRKTPTCSAAREFPWVAALLALTVAAFDAQGQPAGHEHDDEGHPTAVEIAQLPTFCWTQMKVPNLDGPEFKLPPTTECGYGTNHYCSGLVALMRAKRATKADRKRWLDRANINVDYTESAIKDYPKCSRAFRDHVAASRAEINNLLFIYGGGKAPAR